MHLTSLWLGRCVGKVDRGSVALTDLCDDCAVDTADEILTAFAVVARGFRQVIEDPALERVDLLRMLRVTMADLYATALRMPGRPPRTGVPRQFSLLPSDLWVAIRDELMRRLPHEMYWTALLPLTYETVADVGTRQMAEDLSDIYIDLGNGFQLQMAGGTSADVLDWWADWDVSWGATTVRCLAVLHEVIGDLAMGIYG